MPFEGSKLAIFLQRVQIHPIFIAFIALEEISTLSKQFEQTVNGESDLVHAGDPHDGNTTKMAGFPPGPYAQTDRLSSGEDGGRFFYGMHFLQQVCHMLHAPRDCNLYIAKMT